MIAGGVRARVAGAKVDRERFPGSFAAVVQERVQRVVAEAAFERRGGLLLLTVDVDQGGVEVDDQRGLRARPLGRGMLAGQGPGLLARGPASPGDRGHHGGRVLSEGGERAGDRWGRGDVTEQARLAPQQVGVTGDLPAHRESHREVQQDLGGVMLGQRFRP